VAPWLEKTNSHQRFTGNILKQLLKKRIIKITQLFNASPFAWNTFPCCENGRCNYDTVTFRGA